MKYQVLDFDEPADCHHCKAHSSWNCSSFDTLEKAIDYAQRWFYPYFPVNPKDLEVNKKYSYGGFDECTMEIRETI